jgi:hypothetical protein
MVEFRGNLGRLGPQRWALNRNRMSCFLDIDAD